MKIGKHIETARSYAKRQKFDCFITKCARNNYHVKGCYEFKGNEPHNLVETVRYVADKDILRNSKDKKSKVTTEGKSKQTRRKRTPKVK
jgi:hypothetical protein